MRGFPTKDILEFWHSKLIERFSSTCRLIEREYPYINQNLPFRALHMGKKDDEYFLDGNNERIRIRDLLNNLDRLIIRDYQDVRDLSLKDKQAEIATSRADLFIEHERAQIVIELEVFKDKPFSNLIYIPQVCRIGRIIPFYFIHCFAPERRDDESELTRHIGCWLQGQPGIDKYTYVYSIMPDPPESIKYLLPPKEYHPKAKGYRCTKDRSDFHQYLNEFCEDSLIPTINKCISV